MSKSAENQQKTEIKKPSMYLRMDILAIIQKHKDGDEHVLTEKICEHIMKRDMGLTLL